jgi:hypothetical protein
VSVIESATSGAIGDTHLVQLLEPVVAASAARPCMLIDCRDPADRERSTATYGLLAALGLAEASPVALTCVADAAGAYGTLRTVVSACPGDLPALLVATAGDSPKLVATALVADRPLGPHSVEVNDGPPPSPTAEGHGFVTMLAAIALDTERAAQRGRSRR